ncbi:hypothetical protein U2F26_13680 [Micromonospora sp. 4G57]|uniref:Uncharacterized protein n=1 Tax=Micromonospora sicca TaxID=2202420 RepID=A0ABU5JAV0_9ACTN|nr:MULTISPECIES: hypothetical protein [unclassified Micromonospora]MDZ5443774.1 hypothetical protein [Micromonospora sp. 4G57]MDZ5489708.1 hypothetical protein [Micromonospora sp. 4G53]
MRPHGTHRSDREEIRDGLFASLGQPQGGRPGIEVEQWDPTEPAADNPTDVIELGLDDAVRLSGALARLVVAGGAR